MQDNYKKFLSFENSLEHGIVFNMLKIQEDFSIPFLEVYSLLRFLSNEGIVTKKKKDNTWNFLKKENISYQNVIEAKKSKTWLSRVVSRGRPKKAGKKKYRLVHI